MNRNHLKIIACISMLVDHIGYFLFPEIEVLRWIGRIAFPLFAFFIGEGCVYTSSRKKYHLSVFLLGVGCQAVYIAEDLISNGKITFSSDCLFLNILLTFSLGIFACFTMCDIREAYHRGEKKAVLAGSVILTVYILALFAMCTLLWFFRKQGDSLYFDYGICGMLLPLSAAVYRDRKLKLLLFTLGVLIYCLVFTHSMPHVWFSLISPVLLLFYNGKSGSKKFKYLFYIFYPAHLGIIYLIDFII